MKTMIKVLDEIGGIPEGKNVLLIGPPGPEKMMLSVKALFETLNKGEKGIYVTTDQSPAEIEERAKEYNADISKFTNKSLWFVDCYSWTLEQKPTRVDIFVPGPSALNDLSIGLAKSLRETANSPKIVFQSISTLLLYNNPETVFRFLQIIGARLKAANATTLFHCEEAMHDQQTLITLKHLTDAAIEIKLEGEKYFLSAPSLGIKEWKEFQL